MRRFLSRLLALPSLGLTAPAAGAPPKGKILIKSAWAGRVGGQGPHRVDARVPDLAVPPTLKERARVKAHEGGREAA